MNHIKFQTSTAWTRNKVVHDVSNIAPFLCLKNLTCAYTSHTIPTSPWILVFKPFVHSYGKFLWSFASSGYSKNVSFLFGGTVLCHGQAIAMQLHTETRTIATEYRLQTQDVGDRRVHLSEQNTGL